MDYTTYIQWLEDVPRYGKKDGIHNMQVLMERFGNSQDRLPVIHVAGTNGKGSVCAMLASVLRQSGYRVGLYTSPHLIEYTERIQIDGQSIAREDWLSIGLEVKEVAEQIAAAGGNHATFFELITAIAFVYFARAGVDVVVLETGVGGRLDATNVVKHPALCVITSISLDHTKTLGDTLEAIAAEKAGILQSGAPVVLAQNPPCVRQVVQNRAKELGCAYYEAVPQEGYAVSLVGDYQKQNMAAAIQAARVLQAAGWSISDEALRQGLSKAQWPGRMEMTAFSQKPLLLDGAHNPAGAEALAEYLSRHYAAHPGRVALVFSALAKKDTMHIMAPLHGCPAIGPVIFTCIDGENRLAELADLWNNLGERPAAVRQAPAPRQTESVKEALQTAAEQDVDLIVGAGSLYLIGDIKALLQSEAEHV